MDFIAFFSRNYGLCTAFSCHGVSPKTGRLTKRTITMKAPLRAGATAIALFATVGAAAAAGATSETHALKLTTTQRHEIYRAVSKQKMSQPIPAKFAAMVGETVPSSVKLNPLPASAVKQVPAAKSYNYARLGDDVILVNPSSKKVADIITR
jgi:hypothetical protein